MVHEACKWLRLKHEVYDTELKMNKMERFIQKIKDRTERYDDYFPCMKWNCDRMHIHNLLKMNILYLQMKTDRIRFMKLC
jgi:putative transposase